MTCVCVHIGATLHGGQRNWFFPWTQVVILDGKAPLFDEPSHLPATFKSRSILEISKIYRRKHTYLFFFKPRNLVLLENGLMWVLQTGCEEAWNLGRVKVMETVNSGAAIALWDMLKSNDVSHIQVYLQRRRVPYVPFCSMVLVLPGSTWALGLMGSLSSVRGCLVCKIILWK